MGLGGWCVCGLVGSCQSQWGSFYCLILYENIGKHWICTLYMIVIGKHGDRVGCGCLFLKGNGIFWEVL